MDVIDSQFKLFKDTPHTTHEHFGTLRKYASHCEHITECGVAGVVTTWAFLKGLTQNNLKNKRLVSVDTNYDPRIEKVKQVAPKVNISFIFLQGNDIELDLEPTDLLYIDTWHIYGHLKRELQKHAHKVRKYIILHDTEIDADRGESLRLHLNVELQSIQHKYPVEEITKGLWPAVEEFLDEHRVEWRIHEKFANCYGLTILKRI